MRINVRRRDARERLMANYWYRWYAWHPVKIDHEWVWLEWVQRQSELVAAMGYCVMVTTYRFIPNIGVRVAGDGVPSRPCSQSESGGK